MLPGFRFIKAVAGFTLKIAKAEIVYLILPKKNCGKCGYRSCTELAVAVASGKESFTACRAKL